MFLARLANHSSAAAVVSSQLEISKPVSLRSWRSWSGVTRKLVSGRRAHGNRKENLAGGSGQDVVDRQHLAWLQHAMRLPIHRRLVGNVHRDVLGPDDIEDLVRKRKVKRIAPSIIHEGR